MAQEADVPRGLWGKIEKLIDDKIAQFARSGFLRNASITGGKGLTIKDGGALLLTSAGGNLHAYIGGVTPRAPDGNLQPAVILSREDGTAALAIYDPDPLTDGYKQFLALYDRQQNIIVGDDTSSGQGLARPYIPIHFYPAIFGGRTVTTSNTWTTLWRATAYKQHPKLLASAGAYMDTAGTTGQIRVLVNGVQFGPIQAVTSAAAGYSWGPLPVPGEHESTLIVEIQAQRTSASGGLEVVANYGYGLQT